MKIKLTSIFVNSPNDAINFYTEVLGFVKVMHLPEMQLAIVASAEDPNGTALLLEPNVNPLAKTFQEGAYKSGLPVIVFGSDDIHKDYERLKGAGVVFRNEPTKTEWGTQTLFEDTFGNLIQLHQS